MTPEQIIETKEYAKSVMSIVNYDVNKNECKDIAEYYAYEIIDLIEWMTPQELHRQVAGFIMDKESLPSGTSVFIKKYFDFLY